MQFLMENSNFIIGTVLILQTVGILMGIKPDTFWANQNLYNDEFKYIANLVRKTSSGVDDFTTHFDLLTIFVPWIMVVNLVSLFFKYITAQELKVEHNNCHAPFLDLYISIDKAKFIYEMFGKQGCFNFHFLRMQSIISYIPSIIFL